MSTTIKSRDFESAALKKGFVEIRSHDHIYFRYVDKNGKINDEIFTKISHGSNTVISAFNLSKMKRQLKFEKMAQFQQYIHCTLTLDEYRKMLEKEGFES